VNRVIVDQAANVASRVAGIEEVNSRLNMRGSHC